MELSEEAKEARRAYYRNYYQRNKEKRQEAIQKHWENQAQKAALERAKTDESGTA